MAQNSPYCKAYTANKFRAFPGWNEKISDHQKGNKEKAGQAGTSQLADTHVLYLHDSYVVTDGIFNDENIIFNNVTNEWKKFCNEELKFSIPDYKSAKPAAVTK